MRVMVIVKACASSERGDLPSTELLAAMGAFNQRLVEAGVLVDGAGLKPSSQGVRVRLDGERRTVIDGPFAETKELVSGFWIWNVKSMAEAIDWVKQCPMPMREPSDLEIRPFYEAEDFGAEFTPELREQEAGQCATAVGLEKPRFVDGPELRLAGLNGSYDLQTRVGIPGQWQRFVPLVAGVADLKNIDCYGVCWNNREDCGFDYLTAIATDAATAPLPAEFTALELPARRYAVFTHRGHVSQIPAAIDKLWRQWAPKCGLKLARAPWFERYAPDFDARTGLGGMEFWIPLES